MLAATHLANHEAWKVLRGGPQPVATIHNLSPAVPLRDTDDDRRAAELLDALTFDVWVGMRRDGVLRMPVVPGLPAIEPIERSTTLSAGTWRVPQRSSCVNESQNPCVAAPTTIAIDARMSVFPVSGFGFPKCDSSRCRGSGGSSAIDGSAKTKRTMASAASPRGKQAVNSPGIECVD